MLLVLSETLGGVWLILVKNSELIYVEAEINPPSLSLNENQ